MRRWSRLFALATVFSVTLLTTNVLPAQDKTETKSKKKKKKEAESSATPAAAPAAAPAPAPAAAAKSTKKGPADSAGVSDADIARAQSSGMVWVNTESGVYHKSGRYFGKTKQGKFMSEADAKKANYREAKQEVGTKKK
jgi:hypothetical protein